MARQIHATFCESRMGYLWDPLGILSQLADFESLRGV